MPQEQDSPLDFCFSREKICLTHENRNPKIREITSVLGGREIYAPEVRFNNKQQCRISTRESGDGSILKSLGTLALFSFFRIVAY